MPVLRNALLLKSLMVTWDLSSRKLAENIGCSKSLVHNLASGARNSTSDYVAEKLAKELRIPYSTLFVAPISSTISGQHERLVNTKYVADALDRPEAWVREAAISGAIPATRVGRQFRFKPSDITAYIERAYPRSA